MASQSARRSRTGNYAYATARVRAKKAKLLPRETYEKLLVMDIPEITQTIGESAYRDEVSELASRFAGLDLIEAALNVNEEHTYGQVASFTQGQARELTAAFLDRWNFGDVKAILRGKHFGASQDEILKELLIEDRAEFDFLKPLIGDDVAGVRGVVEALRETGPAGRRYLAPLEGALAAKESPTLQDFEDALDRAYYANLLATIPPTSQAAALFLRFIRREIDARNLLSTLRLARHKATWEDLERVLLPGGAELDLAVLRRFLEAPSAEEVAGELRGTSFGEDVAAALEAYARGASDLGDVAIAVHRHLMGFAGRFSRHNPLSILPIIDYLLRKHTEVANLRAIVRAKEAGIPTDRIRNMLVV